ncbi:hypothetical protein E4U22_001986, partial [Claviceps purpurea]
MRPIEHLNFEALEAHKPRAHFPQSTQGPVTHLHHETGISSQSHGGIAVSLWSHSQQSGKVSGIAPRDIRFGKSDPDSSDAEDHGSAGTEDDESEDIVSQSTVSRDTGWEGIVSDVTGSGDNGLGDVASESKDTGSKGIVSEIAGPGDVGPEDVDTGDVDPGDVGPEDVGPGDVGPGDVGPGDVDPEDVDPEDVVLEDIAKAVSHRV